MKYRIIVHIGMHKTGSSSIQRVLFNELTDPNFKYAELGAPNHTGPIYSCFSSTPEMIHKLRGWRKEEIDRFNAKKIAKFTTFAENCVASNMIISGEGISRLSFEEVVRFKQFLNKFSEQILIVGYVRSPRSFMESAFQQRVKGSLKRFNMPSLYPAYRDTFEKFDKIFGRENVRLWKFDPKSFPGGDVVRDFCRRLDITIAPHAVLRANESISKEALSVLFAFHRYGSGYGIGKYAVKVKDKIVAALGGIKGTKVKFSPELFSPVLEKNRDDILWMENRLAGSTLESLQASKEDIVSESDLLNISASTIIELGKIAGVTINEDEDDKVEPHKIAQLVEVLKKGIVDNILSTSSTADDDLKQEIFKKYDLKFQVGELTRRVSNKIPLVADTVPEADLRELIIESLLQLNEYIKSSNDDEITLVGLGTLKRRRGAAESGKNSGTVERFQVILS